MGRANDFGKRLLSSQLRAAGLVCALLLGTISAGCQSTNETRSRPGDPLVGEIPPPTTPSVGPTPPPQNRANMQTPQTPQSTASKSSLADILTTQAEPLDGGKKLVIADTKQPPPQPLQQSGWLPKDGQPASLPGDQGVGLQQPLPAIQIPPVPPPAGMLPPATANTPPVPQFSGTDTDPLQVQLKAHNVLWQDQETVPGGIRFSCGVANPKDASSQTMFEATAPDRDSAIRAVLQKMDQQ